MLKKTFAVLFFSSLSLLSTSVWPRTQTHTHVQLHSYTSVHVQAVYSQLLQECLTYVKDMFSLTTGHFIIVKHTDIEQQTHVLDWSLGTILKVLWEIFPHPALNRKKSLGKSRKLIFSLPPCCLFLELLQHMSPIPDCTLSLGGPVIQFHPTKRQNHCHGYCCLDAPPHTGAWQISMGTLRHNPR